MKTRAQRICRVCQQGRSTLRLGSLWLHVRCAIVAIDDYIRTNVPQQDGERR